MSILVQYDFRPLPGEDFMTLMENVKIAAALWRRHGANPSLWMVGLGETGNMAFTVPFDNYSEYGACLDSLTNDPDFRSWQAKNLKDGAAEWVRSNLYRNLPL